MGNGNSFISGFLIGGLVGAIVGILLAPKSGSETRSDLLEQSEALRLRGEELAAKVRERVGPAVDSVRDRVQPGARQIARAGMGSSDSAGEGETVS